MKVYITGVAGFLGSHIADYFIKKNHKVVGCDNLNGGYLDNVPKEVEFYEIDCTDLDKVVKSMKGCDVVYHCAASAYEGLSVFSPAQITKDCFQATSVVASAAIQNKVKRFIFTSSMARYGNKKAPFHENMVPSPVDPYGVAKVASEDLLRVLCDAHGMGLVIAVPHNIYGERQKYDDPYRNVASIMINLMLQERQPIIYGDGEQKRCFSHIKDCISCLGKLAIKKNVLGEVINIGPDEESVTINQLFKIISEEINIEVEPIYYPDRPREVKLATCSSDKARELLNYSTQYTLKQGISELVRWISEKKPKPFNYEHVSIEIDNEILPITWKRRLF